MALITCPECKKPDVSSLAPLCPNCHYPINGSTAPVANPALNLRPCMDCGGSREIPQYCYECDGKGKVQCPKCLGYWDVSPIVGDIHWRCPNCDYGEVWCYPCHGTGNGPPERCSTCKGSGQLTVTEFDKIEKSRAQAKQAAADLAAKKKREAEEAEAERKRQWEADAPRRVENTATQQALLNEAVAERKRKAEADTVRRKAEEKARQEAQQRAIRKATTDKASNAFKSVASDAGVGLLGALILVLSGAQGATTAEAKIPALIVASLAAVVGCFLFADHLFSPSERAGFSQHLLSAACAGGFGVASSFIVTQTFRQGVMGFIGSLLSCIISFPMGAVFGAVVGLLIATWRVSEEKAQKK